jgi:hypothetical protein
MTVIRGTKIPLSDWQRASRKKKDHLQGIRHQKSGENQPKDMGHVNRERRKSIQIVTGQWLRPFED